MSKDVQSRHGDRTEWEIMLSLEAKRDGADGKGKVGGKQGGMVLGQKYEY